MGNEVRIKASVDDKVSTPLRQMEDKFKSFGKTAGAAIGGDSQIAKGVGLAAGLKAFSLLDGAVTGVIGVMGDSIHAYQEEQVSVGELNASLKANVAGYDGNRAAIEKVLTARMALGFSDEDQRTSLALLVGATHDVNKALEIESTAMDLARFKHISLADASEALTKVEAGSYRVLKSLGIVLKEGATQQDALNAVQAVAMGQAEEYANSDLGKLEVAQIKVNEAQEKFGKGLSHLQASVMPAAADAIESLASAIDPLSKSYEKWQQERDADEQGAKFFFQQMAERAQAMGLSIERTYELMQEAGSANLSDLQYWLAGQQDVMGKGERAAWKMAFGVEGASEKSADALKDVGRAADGAAHKLAEAIYGPDELAGEMAKLNDSLATDKKHLHDLEKIKNPTAAQRADIIETKGRIAETKGKTLELRVQMALLNGTGLDGLITELSGLARGTGHAADEARALLALLRQVRAVTLSMPANAHIGGKAAGGPVTGGTTYIVGEKGPELFTPGASGAITPNSALRSGSVSGVGGMTVIFNSNFAPTRDQANEIARVIGAAMDRRTSYTRTNPTFVPA